MKKIRDFDLPLEIKIITSKLHSQLLAAETYGPNPEVLFTQTTDPKIGFYFNLGKTVFIVLNPITQNQNVFASNAKVKKENGILILDRDRLWNLSITKLKHTRIRVIQKNNVHPNL